MRRLLRTMMLSCLFTIAAFGAEVDQFTVRSAPLADSLDLLNSRMNYYLEKALAEANSEGKGCSDKVLYKKLRQYYANHMSGEVVLEILKTDMYDKRVLNIKDTVFKDYQVKDGFLLASRLTNKNGVALAPVIRVGNYQIGSDKMEHFFGRGFAYFKQHYGKGKDIVETLRISARDEKFRFGGISLQTGVFSYGDLAANFSGIRFWNDILGKGQDPLGQMQGPYVVCREGKKFEKSKDIAMENYVDGGWDEGVNCPQFPKAETAAKVRQSMNKLASQSGEIIRCPMDEEQFIEASQKYGELAPYLLNSRGIVKTDIFEIFKSNLKK